MDIFYGFTSTDSTTAGRKHLLNKAFLVWANYIINYYINYGRSGLWKRSTRGVKSSFIVCFALRWAALVDQCFGFSLAVF